MLIHSKQTLAFCYLFMEVGNITQDQIITQVLKFLQLYLIMFVELHVSHLCPQLTI